MTSIQKTIKYIAMAIAILLCVCIISGIVGAVGAFGFLFGDGDSPKGEMENYETNDGISELQIEIAAAQLRIHEGDKFLVETNNKNITVNEDGGKLVVREKGKAFGVDYDADELLVDVCLPKGITFDKVSIKTGAGTVAIDSITSEVLYLELGAGRVDIESLTATKRADIDGGAGQINIMGGSLKDLDLDMGIGELNMTSALTGDADIDCGIGSVNITLLGAPGEYKLDVEKGLGETRVDGKSFNGIYGDGANRVDIDGGIGRIEVKFK